LLEKKVITNIQVDDYDYSEEMKFINKMSDNSGSIVTFNGIVRGTSNKKKLKHLFLEHYPGMTENSINDVAVRAYKKWELDFVRVIHRVGKLSPEENIVFVGLSSTHRENSFLACKYIMDFLKSAVPLWKKEVFHDREYWIKQVQKDIDSLNKW
tara:strand:- start:115 stop:576 length:462 start_codon:yes stop_codon:yes gene_type:complete